MYEYRPSAPKTRERVLTAWLVCFSLLLLCGSFLPSLPFSLSLRSLALLPLFLAVLIASSCLLRDYVYRIEENECGEEELVVLERRGQISRVSCRIVLSQISSVLEDTPQNRRAVRDAVARPIFYTYTARIFSKERYLILLREPDGRACVSILADQGLLERLKSLL